MAAGEGEFSYGHGRLMVLDRFPVFQDWRGCDFTMAEGEIDV